MIDNVLIEQGAVTLGLELTSDAVEETMEASIVAGGGEAGFEEWLKATGQSRDEYRAMLRRALLSQMVMQAIGAGVVEARGSDAVADLQVAAFEQWLAQQRDAAMVERFVGE
jgi:hypothetical protein